MKLLFLLLLTSCAIAPSYELSPNRLCKRSEGSTVCPGYNVPETNLQWLIRTKREYSHENY